MSLLLKRGHPMSDKILKYPKPKNNTEKTVRLKLIVTVGVNNEYEDDPFYELLFINSGLNSIEIVKVGAYEAENRSKEIEVKSPFFAGGHLAISSKKKESFTIPNSSLGHHSKPIFYVKTKDGIVVSESNVDEKDEARKGLLKVVVLIAIALVLVVLLGQHRHSSFDATGVINVTPDTNTTKTYRLRVGDPNAKDGITNSIFVQNETSHWYSFSTHDIYTINTATWPNGDKLTFQDISGCIVKNRKAAYHCIADDGKGYFIGINSVGPSLNND
jgi:hypothetical protein